MAKLPEKRSFFGFLCSFLAKSFTFTLERGIIKILCFEFFRRIKLYESYIYFKRKQHR